MSLTQGLKAIACYTSLALGLKSRIRRSDIEVFPGRSCVLYVPSTRVQKIVACHTSLAQGLKGRIRRSDIGVFPRRSYVLYVPSTRVKKQDKTIGNRSLS